MVRWVHGTFESQNLHGGCSTGEMVSPFGSRLSEALFALRLVLLVKLTIPGT
jgi:hypothetical protein